MNIRKLMMLTMAAAAAWGSPLLADIRVRGYTSTGTLVYSPSDVASWANVNIALGSTGATKIFVYDSNGSPGHSDIPNESVGDIDISASGTSTLYLVIGDPTGLGSNPAIPARPIDPIDLLNPDRRYAVGLGAIAGTARTRVVLIAQISGEVATNSAHAQRSIDVGKVRRLVTDGAVIGAIGARNDALGTTDPLPNRDFAIGLISAASTSANSNIVSGSGTFSSIGSVSAGTISGPISAEGSIYTINATGDISLAPVTYISARALIDSVEANNITGGISCSNGAVRRVRTRTGNLNGSVIGKTISGTGTDSGVNVAGTLTGQISAIYLSDPAACDITVPITVGSVATGSGFVSYGKISANITSTTGKLGIIQAGSAFGSATVPVTITAATGIDEFSTTSTAGASYANVTCTTGGIGTFSVPYPLGGTITTDSIANFNNVYHWGAANLVVRNAVPAGSVYAVLAGR